MLIIFESYKPVFSDSGFILFHYFVIPLLTFCADLAAIAQKLNSSLADSKVGNRALREEFGKELEQLLREGLILQNEAKAAQQREDSTGYLDAGKKTVYRNQKGGSGKGAAVNRNEIKETTAANLWEKRAKDLGYKPKPAGYQKYKKYIQMLDG